MPSITYTNYGDSTGAAFAGDFFNREHLVPGGCRLDPAAFTGLTNNVVPAGSIVGCTNAEAEAGAALGPAADTDTQVFITTADVDLDLGVTAPLYRHGSQVKADRLAGYVVWGSVSAAVKALVHAQYNVIKS